jgi:hypothetical protein
LQDISITVTSAAEAQAHLGVGEGAFPGLYAIARDAGSTADVAVAGDVSLTSAGVDAYAFISGIVADASNGGAAQVDLRGNVTLSSDAGFARTYALIESIADGAAGSSAAVHIAGDVTLESVGDGHALSRLAVISDSNGTVDIDGTVSASSTADDATVRMQVISQPGAGGQIDIGALDMSVNGAVSGHGWMDIYTNHGGINVGEVNVSASGKSDASVYVQYSNNAAYGENFADATFQNHNDSTSDVNIGRANLSGEGEVHLYMGNQVFGTINQGAGLSLVDLHFQLEDLDASGVEAARTTVVNRFTADQNVVIYNGAAAVDGVNFTDAGAQADLASLNAAFDAALDGTNTYVFAVYTGADDINGDGRADTNSGVLAWDADGTGITSVLILTGVTSLTANDIAT